MLPLFNNAIYASAAINNYNNVADAAQVLYDDRERAAAAPPPPPRKKASLRRSARSARSLAARVPLDIPVNLCQGET